MLWRLLSAELSPYPGRLSLVTRMTIACSLTMVLIMVFRMPAAALGVYLTLLIPRDSLRATVRALAATATGSVLGAVAILCGAMLFAASPLLHILWAAASLFAVFYLMSAMTVPAAPGAIGLLVINAISIWDAPSPANARVTLTLYMEGAILLGCAVVAAVEILFAHTHAPEMVFSGIRERLALARRLLECSAGNVPPSHRLHQQLRLYERRGVGRLREILQRSGSQEPARDQLGAVLALSAELVELCANLAERTQLPSPADKERLHALAALLAQIERRLHDGELPDRVELPAALPVSASMPSLSHVERIVDLLADAFSEESQPAHLPEPPAWNANWFAPDARTSGRHLRTALRGWLSAMLCYLAYVSMGWKGWNAAVATCLLTALTSIGLSRQRQFLRLLGVVCGGLVLGVGSQILVFPNIEDLPAFAVAFAASIFLCSWVAAAGPRLSYGGLQMALAYTLITLSSFGINTSLVPARDVLGGILLGLAAMWLIFDHLWSVSSASALRALFANNLRRIAALHPSFSPVRLAQERAAIARNFEDLQSYADSVIFEPHLQHTPEAAIVERVRHWQPELRALSLSQFGLLRHIAGSAQQSSLSAEVTQEVSQTLLELAGTFHQPAPTRLPPYRLNRFIEKLENPGTEMDPLEARLTHSLAVLARDLREFRPSGEPED
ncbi:MAG TPA: FUSC family protein [Bryobacteraceae bacterium]|nr:FUSC family protein [Bryobacteraceae bacterium]